MDKLKDAMTFLFKEKNWALKMLLPFGITLLTLISSLALNSDPNYAFDSSYNLNGYRNFNNYSTYSAISGMFSLLICCLAIPFAFISSWYSYESAQSGIQNRPTKAIWEGDFGDNLKKAGKYLLATFIYGLIFGSIILAIVFGVSIVLSVLGVGIFSLNAGAASTTEMIATMGGGYVILLCCGLCLLFAVILAISLISFFIVTPGLLRLAGTNSFGEAFKISENWKLAMKYKGQFLGIFLVYFIAAILIGIVGGIFGFFSGLLSFSSPIIALGISLVASYVIAVISTYYTYFFYPRFSGLIFREIVQNDSSLSYIPLKEGK